MSIQAPTPEFPVKQTVFFYSRSQRTLTTEGGTVVMTHVSLDQAAREYGLGEYNCVVRQEA